MTTPKNLKRLQALVWILVYGGLLTLVLGLATARYDADLGACLSTGGGIVAALGVVLIFVRARLKPTP